MPENSYPAEPAADATVAWDAAPWVREIVRCPVSGAPLREHVDPDSGVVELISTDPKAPLAYPVRDGIPVLLASEARAL